MERRVQGVRVPGLSHSFQLVIGTILKHSAYKAVTVSPNSTDY